MEAVAFRALSAQSPDRRTFQHPIVYNSNDVQRKFFLDLYNFPLPDEDNNESEPNDSPWAIVGGVMKYFRMSYEEVVFNRSYLNILLLNRSIPSFHIDDHDDNNNPSGSKINGLKRAKTSGHRYKNETELFMSLM